MKTSSVKRFTLIELLVVIAIIGILAGLVFPALGTVRNNAKKSKASTECMSLKSAIVMYESEFSCWPANVSGSTDALVNGSDYVKMCKILTGENAKKMVFYEVGVGYDEYDAATSNSAPTIPRNVVITPEDVDENSMLIATASGSTDPDGDKFAYMYQWYQNGELVAGETMPYFPYLTENITITDGKFEVPDAKEGSTLDVMVNVLDKEIVLENQNKKLENGKLAFASPRADRGEEVVVNITPDSGYRLKQGSGTADITTDSSTYHVKLVRKDDNTVTFTMPSGSSVRSS